VELNQSPVLSINENGSNIAPSQHRDFCFDFPSHLGVEVAQAFREDVFRCSDTGASLACVTSEKLPGQLVVVEMIKASWLVSGAAPGVERQPLKKLEPDATTLVRLIERWRNEAIACWPADQPDSADL
jgi:hypothetical protein